MIGIKKCMHVCSEQYPILNRVDRSIYLIGWRNGGPAAVVRLIPEILICQREDMSDFEEAPSPKFRSEYTQATDNASTISITYGITKRYDARSGVQRKGTK